MQWVRLVKALAIKEFQLNSPFSPKPTPRSSPDLKLQSAYVQNWISNNVNEVLGMYIPDGRYPSEPLNFSHAYFLAFKAETAFAGHDLWAKIAKASSHLNLTTDTYFI